MMHPDRNQFRPEPPAKPRWHPSEILLLVLLGVGEVAALGGLVWRALS